jgi:tetratricopeptide (TPR) repeat protein
MQQIAEAYYEPYPATIYITKRSPEEKAEMTNTEEAFHLYQAGDYDKSIQLFEELSVEDQNEYTRFYLASAYQAIGELDKAIGLYEGLIETHGIFKSQSQWYMALCYLFKNDIDASRDVLKKLSTSTDSYGPKALKLLNDIQN